MMEARGGGVLKNCVKSQKYDGTFVIISVCVRVCVSFDMQTMATLPKLLWGCGRLQKLHLHEWYAAITVNVRRWNKKRPANNNSRSNRCMRKPASLPVCSVWLWGEGDVGMGSCWWMSLSAIAKRCSFNKSGTIRFLAIANFHISSKVSAIQLG